MLYSAQKPLKPRHNQPHTEYTPTSTINTIQQTSLHSFWSLPSRTSSYDSGNARPFYSSSTATPGAANCEDCETSLISEDGDAMDIDMDVGAHGSALDYACSKCRKIVCHRCAISNLGSDRRCLICAGKRTWVGGIGWIG